MKPIKSDIIMNGDTIKTKDGIFTVSIKGRPGTYVVLNGKNVNIAVDKEGFLKSKDTGEEHRAIWTILEVIERAQPCLFSDDGRYLKSFKHETNII